MQFSKWILPVIVISQFGCTSLWFAGNGVMPDLVRTFGLDEGATGYLTSAVQLGFIIGTLLFAIFTIADRYSPSKVFLWSAVMGALANLAIIWEGHSLMSILCLRFFTGFFLAGIYPVGMKIAADYYDQGLGKSLGFLVGALVMGTAFPHLLKDLLSAFSWKYVLISTSILAVSSGLMMAIFVPDGPYRKPNQQLNLGDFFSVFKNRDFRSAAFGYFGHMWELYAFWAFVPVMLDLYQNAHPDSSLNVPLWSFLIIGIGGLACVLSGYLTQLFQARRTVFLILFLSGICCLAAPQIFPRNSPPLFITFLLFWGMVVIADSPIFSTLVAQNAPAKLKGTALTIVNCIGYSTTIVSIQLLSGLSSLTDSYYIYMVLAIGPLLGLFALAKSSAPVKTNLQYTDQSDN